MILRDPILLLNDGGLVHSPVRGQLNKNAIIPLGLAYTTNGNEDVTLDVISFSIGCGSACHCR